MELRQYQLYAVNEALAEVEMFGNKNVVIEAPTGSGKSLIISEIARQLDGFVLILVNITALIDQISEHLTELDVPHSILKAGREDEFDDSQRVQLVMSQTFYARKDKLNIRADYIIQDERHKEYNTDRTNAILNSIKPKSIIGLSATPYDSNGYLLENAYLIKTSTIEQLEASGFLSPIRYLVPKWSTQIDFSDVKMTGNDYNGNSLDDKFNNPEYMALVVKSMNQINAKNKKTIVFCNSISHCDNVTSFLLAEGYSVGSVHSKKSEEDNDQILSDFRANKCMCLVSVSKLSIGFDVKDIQLGVCLRPTKVRSLFIQMVGRVARIFKGKEYAEFLDCCGIVKEHGFHNEIYEPPEFGNKKALAEAKAKAEASAIGFITKEEPTWITRTDINVFVEQLNSKMANTRTIDNLELKNIFETSNDLAQLVKTIFEAYRRRYCIDYKQSTIDWITDHWLSAFKEYPHSKDRWTRAFKTRARNIFNEQKKLASLYYFIDFLVENQDSFYVVPSAYKEPITVVEDEDIPF